MKLNKLLIRSKGALYVSKYCFLVKSDLLSLYMIVYNWKMVHIVEIFLTIYHISLTVIFSVQI